MTRVFITGLGAVTPIGNDVPTFWENLKNGVSGAARIASFDPAGYITQIACEVKDFNPLDYMERKLARRIARSTQFALAASRQALQDAGFEITPENAPSVGVVMNTGGGGIDMVEDATRMLDTRGPRGIGPFFVPSIMANAASCLVSIETGATGPVLTSTLACASGNYAIIQAYHAIQRGEAEAVITGGVEGGISPLITAAFGRMQATSTRNDDPQRASRPFDAERDGFVQGEGGVVMLLESEEHARARGAKIYAEVLGGRLTGDAYHVTAPHPEGDGAVRAMRGALQSAGLTVDDVDVIYAHGTSTPLNDAAETKVIKTVFGERAYQIPISGTKSMVGHMLGAAGAISALAAVLAFNHGVIPPTINQEHPDPECDLDYVPNEARPQQTNVALVNAFGFGGQNVVLVLKRYTGE
ncbi:MAG: beta-ketoacyl-[acyl-carrier-protein] synthase II [Caldilineae bacterium]|nr:MAG: beta-ketoacyl-[acyl-carrier-protein] synthase II [Caldilineae bacterium]